MLFNFPLQRIQGDFGLESYTINPGAAGATATLEDPTRFSVLFALSGGTQILLRRLADSGANTGLTLNASAPILSLNFRDHGPLVTEAWVAVATGAAEFLYVANCYYRPYLGRPDRGLPDRAGLYPGRPEDAFRFVPPGDFGGRKQVRGRRP